MTPQKNILFLLAIAFCATANVSCNSYVDKTDGKGRDMAPVNPADFAKLDFDMLLSDVIAPRCLQCHSTEKSKEPALTNYADVMAYVKAGDPMNSQLYQDLASGDMPKNQPAIGPNQLSLVALWIAAGAPQNAGEGHAPTNMPTPGPTPTPTSPPVRQINVDPTFSSLNQNVFIPYCLSCHKPDTVHNKGAAGGFDLTSYATMMASTDADFGDPIVDTKDPVNSDIYMVMAKGTMPRPTTDPRLSANVADAILKWMQAGAPNN